MCLELLYSYAGIALFCPFAFCRNCRKMISDPLLVPVPRTRLLIRLCWAKIKLLQTLVSIWPFKLFFSDMYSNSFWILKSLKVSLQVLSHSDSFYDIFDNFSQTESFNSIFDSLIICNTGNGWRALGWHYCCTCDKSFHGCKIDGNLHFRWILRITC